MTALKNIKDKLDKLTAAHVDKYKSFGVYGAEFAAKEAVRLFFINVLQNQLDMPGIDELIDEEIDHVKSCTTKA